MKQTGVCGARARAWGPRQHDLGWAVGERQWRGDTPLCRGPSGTEADTHCQAHHHRQLPLGDRTEGDLRFLFKCFLHSLIFPNTLLLRGEINPDVCQINKHHPSITGPAPREEFTLQLTHEPSEFSLKGPKHKLLVAPHGFGPVSPSFLTMGRTEQPVMPAAHLSGVVATAAG